MTVGIVFYWHQGALVPDLLPGRLQVYWPVVPRVGEFVILSVPVQEAPNRKRVALVRFAVDSVVYVAGVMQVNVDIGLTAVELV